MLTLVYILLTIHQLVGASFSGNVCSCVIFAGSAFDDANIHGHEYLKNELTTKSVRCSKSGYRDCQETCSSEVNFLNTSSLQSIIITFFSFWKPRII